MKKKLKGFLPYLAVIFIVIIFISIYFIFFYKGTSLKRITKVLDTKYDSIECIGSNCNLIKAVNDKKISLLNSKGKKIITYTSNDDNKNLYGGTDNYFISVKKVDDNTVTYILNDIEGKIIYKTNNKLEEINENYILENIKDNEYNVIKKNGKKIYSNIEKIDFYNNKEYISLKINNEYSIFNKRFEKILSNYSVDKEIKDEEDNTIYLIVKNEKTSKYSYFNIKSNKIIGEEFDKYKESENKDELIITKKGKQIKLNDNKEQIDLVNEIKSNLKDKYYLYTSSVIDDDQKYVFVDNLKNNSFGIYELRTKKYSEIYKYSKTENIYSNVTKLDSKKGLYYQVNCSSKKCDTPVTAVYDLTENKVILKLESNEKLPEKYIQYNNGYKVIKYSKSSNSDYKNKYVLYDKNNKELLSTTFVNNLTVINIPTNAYKFIINAGSKELTINEINIRKELEKNETIPSISINDVNWTSSKTIEITYPEGYKNEYSLDLGTTWNEYTEPITVETNTTIFTRVVKDEKVIGSSSFVVTSIDNVEPEISLDIDETIDKGIDIKIPTSYNLGISGGTTICKTGETTVTNISELEVGTHKITCTVTNGANISKSVTKNVIIKEKEEQVIEPTTEETTNP